MVLIWVTLNNHFSHLLTLRLILCQSASASICCATLTDRQFSQVLLFSFFFVYVVLISVCVGIEPSLSQHFYPIERRRILWRQFPMGPILLVRAEKRVTERKRERHWQDHYYHSAFWFKHAKKNAQPWPLWLGKPWTNQSRGMQGAFRLYPTPKYVREKERERRGGVLWSLSCSLWCFLLLEWKYSRE